jgi:hypothetical protein
MRNASLRLPSSSRIRSNTAAKYAGEGPGSSFMAMGMARHDSKGDAWCQDIPVLTLR